MKRYESSIINFIYTTLNICGIGRQEIRKIMYIRIKCQVKRWSYVLRKTTFAEVPGSNPGTPTHSDNLGLFFLT